MAKITKEETLSLTRDEAVSLIKNADGRVRFQVMLRGWLPTSEDRGFEGCTALSVSRRDAIQAVEGMLSRTLEERGAKIRVHKRPGEIGDLSFISIY